MDLKNLSNLELVIFDLDGTLIDSNGVNNGLDVDLAHYLGDNSSAEQILKDRDEVFKNNNAGDIYLNYCDYLRTKFNSNLSKEEILQIRRNFSKEIAKNVEYKPDADVIIKYFDFIITKDDVTLKKPNPEVYNKIIEKFKISDFSKCIVIEDSLSRSSCSKKSKFECDFHI